MPEHFSAEWIRWLVQAFGPVGAFALIALGIAAWVYRRDVLRDRDNGRSREQQITSALVDSAKAWEQNAGAASQLAHAVERLGQQLTDAQREQGRQFHETMLTIVRGQKGGADG